MLLRFCIYPLYPHPPSPGFYTSMAKRKYPSYGYKLKSILKRNLSGLLDNEIPLLSSPFPSLHLTKSIKELGSLVADPGFKSQPKHRGTISKTVTNSLENSDDNYEKSSVPTKDPTITNNLKSKMDFARFGILYFLSFLSCPGILRLFCKISPILM
jgi:hypothetical protein